MLYFLSGLFVGAGLFLLLSSFSTAGKLVIVDDIDDGSYMFLEVNRSNVDKIRRKNYVRLSVVDRGSPMRRKRYASRR